MLVFKWGGVAGESLAILISPNSLSLFFLVTKRFAWIFSSLSPKSDKHLIDPYNILIKLTGHDNEGNYHQDEMFLLFIIFS